MGTERLTPALFEELADRVADLHRRAEKLPHKGGHAAMRWIVDDNNEELGHFKVTSYVLCGSSASLASSNPNAGLFVCLSACNRTRGCSTPTCLSALPDFRWRLSARPQRCARARPIPSSTPFLPYQLLLGSLPGAQLLDARQAEGYVRECHGDLHLNNITLFKDKPVGALYPSIDIL